MKEFTMEICKMMVMSTGHVTEQTAALLDAESVGVIIYPKGEHGWFVVVCDWQEYSDAIPHDLKACLKLAEKNGCNWLCLDRDGERYSNLPYYNW